MKLKKNSLIILGLSTVALGTIGFSSWIIAGTNPETQLPNVDVTVGDVEDHSIFLELPSQTDNKLKFDADSDAKDKGTVVIAKPDDSQEDMTFTASFIIGGVAQPDFEAAYNSKSVAVEFTSDDLSSLITSKCVQSPIDLGKPVTISELNTTIAATTSKITGESYTNPSDTPTPKYEITFAAGTPSPTGENKDKYGVQVNIAFTFAWGSAFSYKNPVCLKSINDTAKDALNALDKANDFDLSVKISLVNRAQA